jgi:hypothetical protein
MLWLIDVEEELRLRAAALRPGLPYDYNLLPFPEWVQKTHSEGISNVIRVLLHLSP